jgi:hypothetical protein
MTEEAKPCVTPAPFQRATAGAFARRVAEELRIQAELRAALLLLGRRRWLLAEAVLRGEGYLLHRGSDGMSSYQRVLIATALISLTACTGSVKVGPQAIAGLSPSGTVDMNEVQVAYLGNAGGGHGTLYYQGQAYPFTVAGLGVGGIGASTVSASGEVYKLDNIAQFPGTYGQASYGFVLGTKSTGDLWLQNQTGVILHLKAKREGLMLSLGGDAVSIQMNQGS